jgi:Fe2+ transport system protein B
LITTDTWKIGITSGLKTAFVLLKIIIPVFAFVTFLEHTPVVEWISDVMDPLLHLVGLPGKASMAIVTGMFFNFYASIGIIVALELTAWQMTIIAVMLSCCHELIIETAIINKAGIRGWPIACIRFITAIIAGVLLNGLGKIWL